MLGSFLVRRGVFLLSLAAVLFVIGSEGVNKMTCCSSVSRQPVTETILGCYEQKPEWGCKLHAYVVATIKDQAICVDPRASWFRKQIKKTDCAPVVNVPSFRLDEVDEE